MKKDGKLMYRPIQFVKHVFVIATVCKSFSGAEFQDQGQFSATCLLP